MRLPALIALSLTATAAYADSPLDPAYLEVLVVDDAEIAEARGAVTIAGVLADASCGDGKAETICGSGQAFVVFLDRDGAPAGGYFGEVLDWRQHGGDVTVELGGLGASRLDLLDQPFRSATYAVHTELDRREMYGAVAHLDERGSTVWAVEGTTLTPGELVASIGEDCWITADADGVRAMVAIGRGDALGIWGTGGTAIWGTDGTSIWGTGGVSTTTKGIWGTGGVSLGAIWGTGGTAIWGTSGTAAVVPWPGGADVMDLLPTLDAPTLAAEGIAVEGDWTAAAHMAVTPL